MKSRSSLAWSLSSISLSARGYFRTRCLKKIPKPYSHPHSTILRPTLDNFQIRPENRRRQNQIGRTVHRRIRTGGGSRREIVFGGTTRCDPIENSLERRGLP